MAWDSGMRPGLLILQPTHCMTSGWPLPPQGLSGLTYEKDEGPSHF